MQRCAIGVVLTALAFVGGRSVLAGGQPLIPSDALKTMQDAVNKGDARRYASVYDASATINIFGATVLQGRSAIEKHEIDLLAQFPHARFALLEVWLSGRQAVARYGINAETLSKLSMGHEGLLFFTFNAAGEIERENRYLDSLTPMAQLGALKVATPRAAPALPSRWREHHRRAADAATEARNVATARNVLDALHSRRRDVVIRALASAPTIDEVMLTDTFAGADGATRWLSTLDALADASFAVVAIAGVGRHVLVEGILTASVSKPFGLLKPAATRATAHRAAVIEFDAAGRITGVKAFMNGKELAESTGQWPIR